MKKFQIALALLVAMGAGTLAGSWATAKRGRTIPILMAAQASGAASGVSFSEGFAPIVKGAVPAVVNVSSSKVVRTPGRNIPSPFSEDPLLRQFFGDDFPQQFQIPPSAQREQSLGSGVIVNADGYILTNNHVLNGAKDIKVLLRDKREFQARVVGTDSRTDVAVLKVDAHNLPVLAFGDSSQLEAGNFVLAIGNPFGLNQTVTLGIVSATGRAGLGIEALEDFIQTDAAINPGNSGGALIDARGDLVGINTAILTEGNGGNQGVGFAVPANLVRNVMEQILKNGKVTRAWLGVSIQTVTQDIAKAFHLGETSGALVNGVTNGGPAAKAGVEPGDIIVDINGQGIDNDEALQLKIGAMTPGTAVKLTVFRNGTNRDLTVTLGEMPAGTKPGGGEVEGQSAPTRGISAGELTRSIASQLQLPADTKGVVVTSVDPASAAAEAGLQQGDVIEEVNRQPVTNVAGFTRAMQSAGQQPVLLLIARNGATTYLVVQPQ